LQRDWWARHCCFLPVAAAAQSRTAVLLVQAAPTPVALARRASAAAMGERQTAARTEVEAVGTRVVALLARVVALLARVAALLASAAALRASATAMGERQTAARTEVEAVGTRVVALLARVARLATLSPSAGMPLFRRQDRAPPRHPGAAPLQTVPIG
jgi:uncharacterized protein with GYD domain